MRRSDDYAFDPELAPALEAIDATLAGEPIEPEFAELAELALLLAGDRPEPRSAFVLELDTRVRRRFASSDSGGHAPRLAAPRILHRFQRWWLWAPAAGLVAALAVATVIVFAGGRHRLLNSAVSSSAATATAGASPAAGHRAAAASSAGASSSASPASAPVLAPPPNGRKIIQSSQLSLSAASNRIDDVAQEIFVVVGQANGIVNSSTVTAAVGPGAYAQFQLSIPSTALPQTMSALSGLRYSRVVSRTDSTQDVNNEYQDDIRRLADDRALRTSLLKQLANASTQAQIDSLDAQLHDADAAISTDESALSALNAQVNYSRVSVTINGGVVEPGVAPGPGGGGFGVGRAARDAARVLDVAAGVALIGLAALVPFALLASLGWWTLRTLRRRRRQQALDAV